MNDVSDGLYEALRSKDGLEVPAVWQEMTDPKAPIGLPPADVDPSDPFGIGPVVKSSDTLLAPEPGYMDAEEQRIADELYAAIMLSSSDSTRSRQAQEFKVGVSDLGFCSERTRRMLNRQEPDETDWLKAAIGTALGDMMETAYKTVKPSVITQAEVTLTLTGELRTYTITGHPDIIDGNLVLDGKSAGGLSGPRRSGFTDRQKQFQRHGYGYAAWEMGLLGDIDITEVRVGNVWIDRTGNEQALHVRIEPLDMDVIDEMSRWLDEVYYAAEHEEEATKEPAREMCAVACGFFRVCRATDTDVTGLLTDPTVLNAVELDREGFALQKRAKAMRDEAKGLLAGVEGSTGEWVVRWTHINPAEVAAFKRAAHDKLQITAVRQPKKAKK